MNQETRAESSLQKNDGFMAWCFTFVNVVAVLLINVKAFQQNMPS